MNARDFTIMSRCENLENASEGAPCDERLKPQVSHQKIEYRYMGFVNIIKASWASSKTRQLVY